MRRLALALALAGCEDPDTLRIHVEDLTAAPSEDLPDVVHEACDLWEIDCSAEPRDYARGSVTIYLIAPPVEGQPRAGQTIAGRGDCHDALIAGARADVVAHELGHILLDTTAHSADPAALMHEHIGIERTRAQTAAVLEGVRRINRLCA